MFVTAGTLPNFDIILLGRVNEKYEMKTLINTTEENSNDY